MHEASPAELKKPAATLVIVGLLYVGGLLVRGSSADPGTDPQGFAVAMRDPTIAAAGWAYVLALLLHGLAVVDLSALARPRSPRAAKVARVASLAAILLTATAMGAILLVFPAAAEMFLEGKQDALQVVLRATVPFLGTILLEGTLLTIGSIALAISLWRAHLGPRWAAVLVAVAAPLYATPAPGFVADVLGSLLLLAAGIGLFLSAGRD